jgi:hypothetical protein
MIIIRNISEYESPDDHYFEHDSPDDNGSVDRMKY